jgi:hypothetical protein
MYLGVVMCCMCNFLFEVQVYVLLYVLYFDLCKIDCSVEFPRACECIIIWDSSPNNSFYTYCKGHAVTQSVEALRYKSEGRGFDSPMMSLEFFIDIILPAALWPLGSTQPLTETGRCVGLTTLPPSCTDCLEIWELQPAGTLRASPGL